jgi:hypothetical protein
MRPYNKLWIIDQPLQLSCITHETWERPSTYRMLRHWQIKMECDESSPYCFLPRIPESGKLVPHNLAKLATLKS